MLHLWILRINKWQVSVIPVGAVSLHCHRDSDLLAEGDVNLLLGQGKMLNYKWEPNSNTHGCFSNDPIRGKAFSPFFICKEIALHGATHCFLSGLLAWSQGCINNLCISSEVSFSVQFSHSVMSNSLHHTRLPCPSPAPRPCSSSCPLSRWCHPTISSSVIPFSSCLQPFPASGSFLMSRLFASGGQSVGASALASVPPMNIQGWFPLGLTGLITANWEILKRE